MSPRKSTSRTFRASRVSKQPGASSSKTTLDALPDAIIPESITPAYIPVPREKVPLTEPQRERLIHELVGFHPRTVCDDITEAARMEIYNTVEGIEGWAGRLSDGMGEEVEREVDIGLHALETLLESHIDKAFDKFTAWALRNAFEIPPDLEVVLPWHQGLDFARGEHVASLPRGEESLAEALEGMRERVEQMRLLSQRLETAERHLDRRLEIAKQRKAEVGFVKEVLSSSGLSPLPPKAAALQETLTNLHQTLSPLDIPPPTSSSVPTGGHTKAWELGRRAYLNWAVGKMVSGSGAGQAEGGAGDRMEGVEEEMRGMGGREGMEKLAKAVGA